MEETRIEKLRYIIKWSSILIGVVLMFLSFFGIFFSILDPKGFILYFYTFIFGVLIVASELGYFKKYFGFMHYYMGRGLFQIFVGLSILIFDWNSNIFAKIVAVFALLVGIGQIIFVCSPQDKKEEEELQDEEAGEVIVVEEPKQKEQILEINDDKDPDIPDMYKAY